ncbi:MAG: c-type cytochrome [Verrucomicrobiaceae bacterium]|nr:c-type cytochrome [Verrucomicrobiaceae bacterium]
MFTFTSAGYTTLLALAWGCLSAAEPGIPPVPDKQPPPVANDRSAFPTMLVPGFVVTELPISLTSLNNIEYRADGALYAGGYDGRFHLLTDSDGDGIEDEVRTFWSEKSANYPLGMVVKDGDLHTVLTDEVVRFRDTDNDGVPDRRETVIKGFDDPDLVAAPYLNHRRVDSSMALAWGPDGAWYLTMGNAGYNNPYWHDQKGKNGEMAGSNRYSTDKRRGCLLRIDARGKVELRASGLRYIMCLQFNEAGDLFGTEQEGATWVPNGNPFDEFLHIQSGRHYGFPPRHPTFLPRVVDEPSVWDFTPQHQSTCGFRFNTPGSTRGRFGPSFWENDAIVTGEARGKLWRTKLVSTDSGYVASSQLIADIGLLAVDCAISPAGDLVVCCHTGKPDWGNGPSGEGRLFKFRYVGKHDPQPIAVWASAKDETTIAFDRALDSTSNIGRHLQIQSGRFIDAGSHIEKMRPGYKVVQMQQRDSVSEVNIISANLTEDRRYLVVRSSPRTTAQNYAIRFREGADKHEACLSYDLCGLEANWRGEEGAAWSGWIPHPDLKESSELLRGSKDHDKLTAHVRTPGELRLKMRLNLFNMLQPATQPGSELGYEPKPETVTLILRSDATLQAKSTAGEVNRVSLHETRLVFENVADREWPEVSIAVATPVQKLKVSYTTDRDSTHERAPGIRRVMLPFAMPATELRNDRVIPELVGGDWNRGATLFKGKAACFTCHVMRGEGFAVGPDLNNLVHRDYASVLQDIVKPNAVINPDAIGYVVTKTKNEVVTGTRTGENQDELIISQPGGQSTKIKKPQILKVEPMKLSLMPEGLDKILTSTELRDLLTFLLTEPPVATN